VRASRQRVRARRDSSFASLPTTLGDSSSSNCSMIASTTNPERASRQRVRARRDSSYWLALLDVVHEVAQQGGDQRERHDSAFERVVTARTGQPFEGVIQRDACTRGKAIWKMPGPSWLSSKTICGCVLGVLNMSLGGVDVGPYSQSMSA